MSNPKKFFDPKTKTFLIWDEDDGRWLGEDISPKNIEELMYITDYVIAEVKIESMIVSQIDDLSSNNENIFKKELQN